jgi:hypothetical protein
MNEPILQTYLNSQFIQLDDADYDKLILAANKLEQQLRTNRAQIPSYTLLAFDPESDSQAPEYNLVKGLITSQWRSFVSKSKDGPQTYLRSVMLQAIQELTASDADLAGIVYLTLNPIIGRFALGSEKDVLISLMESIGNSYELEAAKLWTVNRSNIDTSMIETPKEITFSFGRFEVNDLADRFGAAIYTSGTDGNGKTVTYKDGNPHYLTPQGSYPHPQWVHHFAKMASQVVLAYVNGAVKEVEKKLNEENIVSVDDYTVLIESINKTITAIYTGSQAADLRNQLIWIKETLYSTISQKSYRQLSPELAAVALATDVSTIIPVVFPVSVDYMLQEILRSAFGERADEAYTLEQLLNACQQDRSSWQTVIVTNPALASLSGSRLPLGSFLQQVSTKQKEVIALVSLVGVRGEEMLTLTEFAVWLFHDRQVQRLCQSN